jgi:ferredoxin/coenzyme F420-reducing hydrogenase delta subunit
VSLRLPLRKAFEALEALAARCFPPGWNPLLQLGALGWFFYWIVAVSGLYLYIFFDTGITQAYDSLESITHGQPWAGGIMRSLHRYASDALVVMVLVHLLREFSHDRMRGKRWFAWISGLPLLAFIYVCGITGYWLVWDVLAQFVALTTGQLLDVLPLFGEPISRNFVNETALSSRFFTLMSFIHIAAPLLMLLFMWIHIHRHASAVVNPARGLGAVVLGSLLVLSIALPATSQPRADLDTVPATVGLDWFYLPVYPLVQEWGSWAVWQLLLGLLLLLALLPWLPRRKEPAAAHVSTADCNGCGRCVADCPFNAVSLAPRSDGLKYDHEAVVSDSRCVSCGLCVGSCPTATPFRGAADFAAGIELPDWPLARLRRQLTESCARLTGSNRLVVFACEYGEPPDASLPNAALVRLPCVGMVPPSYMDYVLSRGLADGVVLAGCGEGSCFHRLGDRWTAQRIAGQRDPWLRERVPRNRIALSWAGRGERRQRRADISAFRERLATLPPMRRGIRGETGTGWRRPGSLWPRPATAVGLVVVLGLLCVTTGIFATWPAWRQLEPGEAVVRLSLRHAAATKVECKPLTAAELVALKPNMRRQVGCPRERWPIYVELERDEELIYADTHQPAGLWDDGSSTVFRSFVVPAGHQTLTVRMRASGRESGFDHERTFAVDLVAEQNLVIEFHSNDGFVAR